MNLIAAIVPESATATATTTLNFADIFKKNFLEGLTLDLTTSEILTTIALTFLLSVVLFFVYRLTMRSVLYSKSFNISMCAISVVTAIVIMTIKSNVVLSLGMVGALSIVRFRTAIKDPMDLLFLFFSITLGIVMGAKLYLLGLIGTAAISVALLLYTLLPASDSPSLIVARVTGEDAQKALLAALKTKVRKTRVKSTSLTEDGAELTIEVRLRRKDTSFLYGLRELEGVSHIALVAYDGEFMA